MAIKTGKYTSITIEEFERESELGKECMKIVLDTTYLLLMLGVEIKDLNDKGSPLFKDVFTELAEKCYLSAKHDHE